MDVAYVGRLVGQQRMPRVLSPSVFASFNSMAYITDDLIVTWVQVDATSQQWFDDGGWADGSVLWGRRRPLACSPLMEDAGAYALSA